MTTRQRDVLNDHEEILNSVFSGDPEFARESALKQASIGRDLIIDALMSSSSVLGASIEIPKARNLKS